MNRMTPTRTIPGIARAALAVLLVLLPWLVSAALDGTGFAAGDIPLLSGMLRGDPVGSTSLAADAVLRADLPRSGLDPSRHRTLSRLLVGLAAAAIFAALAGQGTRAATTGGLFAGALYALSPAAVLPIATVAGRPAILAALAAGAAASLLAARPTGATGRSIAAALCFAAGLAHPAAILLPLVAAIPAPSGVRRRVLVVPVLTTAAGVALRGVSDLPLRPPGTPIACGLPDAAFADFLGFASPDSGATPPLRSLACLAAALAVLLASALRARLRHPAAVSRSAILIAALASTPALLLLPASAAGVAAALPLLWLPICLAAGRSLARTLAPDTAGAIASSAALLALVSSTHLALRAAGNWIPAHLDLTALVRQFDLPALDATSRAGTRTLLVIASDAPSGLRRVPPSALAAALSPPFAASQDFRIEVRSESDHESLFRLLAASDGHLAVLHWIPAPRPDGAGPSPGRELRTLIPMARRDPDPPIRLLTPEDGITVHVGPDREPVFGFAAGPAAGSPFLFCLLAAGASFARPDFEQQVETEESEAGSRVLRARLAIRGAEPGVRLEDLDLDGRPALWLVGARNARGELVLSRPHRLRIARDQSQ